MHKWEFAQEKSEKFPGWQKNFLAYQKEKMDWSTDIAASYKLILSKVCSGSGFCKLYFQEMRVFSYCAFPAVSEIAVRAEIRAGGNGRGWTQICPPDPLSQCRNSSVGHLHQAVPSYLRAFFTWQFSALLFLGFLAVSSTKMCAPQKQLPFKIQLLLRRCEGKLLWLGADYLPNEMLPFFWVRKCSLWSEMAAPQSIQSTNAG